MVVVPGIAAVVRASLTLLQQCLLSHFQLGNCYTTVYVHSIYTCVWLDLPCITAVCQCHDSMHHCSDVGLPCGGLDTLQSPANSIDNYS